jgi:hypothetical protein
LPESGYWNVIDLRILTVCPGILTVSNPIRKRVSHTKIRRFC